MFFTEDGLVPPTLITHAAYIMVVVSVTKTVSLY